MTEVPVIVLANLTESQRRALVIADNQLALSAGWDEEILRLELAAHARGEFHCLRVLLAALMKSSANKRSRKANMRKGQWSGIDEEPCRIKRYKVLRTIATAIAIRRKPIGT
jgi:ParB-like chromosome segregation protein Spo0J